MRIVIINRTNKPQSIRKSTGDIVTINAYSPYILETNFKPEINFWTNCVDERFIVTDKISELNKLVNSLPKDIVKAQKDIIKSKEVTIAKEKPIETKPTNEEVVIAKEVSNDTVSVDNNNINNTVEDEAIVTLKTAYENAKAEKIENLSNLTVKNLRILAEKKGIEIPNGIKKADLVKLIENSMD